MIELGYSAVHSYVRKMLPVYCAFADRTCRGKLHAALKEDAPTDLIRVDSKRGRFYVGDFPDKWYLRLCQSHHSRYDSVVGNLLEGHYSPTFPGMPAAPRIGKSGGGRRRIEMHGNPATAESCSRGGKVGGIVGGSSKSPPKKAAAKANLVVARHVRWHVNRGIVNPECDMCKESQ